MDGSLPTLVHVYLEQNLRSSLLDAIQYILEGVVSGNYSYLGYIYPYTLEVAAAILLAADICSLSESNSTCTENYFGLERYRVSPNKRRYSILVPVGRRVDKGYW